MQKVRIWPYKFGSEGAKNLQLALQGAGIDCLRIRPEGTYRPRANHLIINWGNSQLPAWRYNWRLMLNDPTRVGYAANKLQTFKYLKDRGVTIPEFTQNPRVASWWVDQSNKVYCRKQLTGHSGSGITVARSLDEIVDAPLYTVGIDVKGEYRVHVFRNLNGEYKVIDIQKKRRRNEAIGEGSLNMDVRNLAGGWVFAHNNIELSLEAQEQAKAAVQALGLDFGAVDLIIEKRTEQPVVLEVNTAPGLSSPTTLAAYVEAIKCYLTHARH